MIFRSLPIMTIIDVVIISLAVSALYVLIRYKQILRQLQAFTAFILIVLGIICVGVFYLVDLFTMFGLPMIVGMPQAMAVMRDLHLNANWIVQLSAIGLIVTGTSVLGRRLFPRIADLLRDLEQMNAQLASDIAKRQRVEKDLQLVRATLEQQVEERTVALLETNTSLHHEIAERQRMQEEREHLITELEAKNTELEQFTYTVSHDLKSPLFTINGFLSYLERDVAAGHAERVQQDVEYVQAAVENMRQLLDDLLELSRSGRVVNPPRLLSFNELVHEVLTYSAGQITAPKVQVDVPAELPSVYGDRGRLVQVVQNLLDNAVKFLGDQPQPCIVIGARQHSKEIVCYVQDNGVGIDPSYHDKIFGLFERLDPHSPGTGVGLTLVKRIIEVHGGRVWVESQPGQGATFYFTLPQADDVTVS